MDSTTWQRHDSELAELEAQHAADTARWAGAPVRLAVGRLAAVGDEYRVSTPCPHGCGGPVEAVLRRDERAGAWYVHRVGPWCAAGCRVTDDDLARLRETAASAAATLTTTDAPRVPRRRDALTEGR